MNHPPTPRSRRSSRNSPPIELELRGSPRLALAWLGWCLALQLSLWAGCNLPWWQRLVPCLLLAWAPWRGAMLLLARGPAACVRLRWEADGRWWLQERSGGAHYVQPGPPRSLGVLVWISWREGGGRRHLVIDGGTMEPNAFRRLKARLKFANP